MTDTPTTTPDAARRPRRDPAAMRVEAVALALGELGVDGFRRARADLATAADLDREACVRATAVETLERDLVDRLAGGADLGDVAGELAAGVVPRLEELAERAIVVCRERAVQAAAAEAYAAHPGLAGVVDAAVADAVEAGRALVDVRALAKRLTPPRAPRGGWSNGGGGPHAVGGGTHPWMTNPPVNLVSLDDVTGDERRAAARARAVAATGRVTRGLEVAGMLEQVGGPGSSLYVKGRDRDQVHFVGLLPAEVQLAVADAIGWEPRLRATGPASLRPRPFDDEAGARARQAAVDAAVRTGRLHRAVDRLTGVAR